MNISAALSGRSVFFDIFIFPLPICRSLVALNLDNRFPWGGQQRATCFAWKYDILPPASMHPTNGSSSYTDIILWTKKKREHHHYHYDVYVCLGLNNAYSSQFGDMCGLTAIWPHYSRLRIKIFAEYTYLLYAKKNCKNSSNINGSIY